MTPPFPSSIYCMLATFSEAKAEGALSSWQVTS
jgi:hypothetical protein